MPLLHLHGLRLLPMHGRHFAAVSEPVHKRRESVHDQWIPLHKAHEILYLIIDLNRPSSTFAR